jgi:hypothetical protein
LLPLLLLLRLKHTAQASSVIAVPASCYAQTQLIIQQVTGNMIAQLTRRFSKRLTNYCAPLINFALMRTAEKAQHFADN